MRTTQGSALLALAWMSGGTVQAQESDPPAQETPNQETPPQAPAAVFVISGGVTMGAYEAGQMYVFTEHIKRIGEAKRACAQQPPTMDAEVCTYANLFPDKIVFAGTSAGSINSALAVSVLLTEGETLNIPENSTFFRAWVPMGARRDTAAFDGFPAKTDEQQMSLFSRAQMQALLDDLGKRKVLAQKDRAWDKPLSLGITTTRMLAQDGPLGERASNVSFGFRAPVEGADSLATAAFTSVLMTPQYFDPFPGPETYQNQNPDAEGPVNDPLGWLLVETDEPVPGLAANPDSRRVGYEPGVLDLVRASGGLPGVFEVEAYTACWVRHHALMEYGRDTSNLDTLDSSCAQDGAVLMVDGGVFDNNPIRLGQFLAMDNGARLIDSEAILKDKVWSKPTYYFFDPDLSRANTATAPPTHEFDRLTGFLQGVLSTARMQELTGWIQENPDADVRNVLPRLRIDDTFSGYFGAFLGIYDRSFRVWDFYVGMRDAMEFLEDGRGAPAVYHEQNGVRYKRTFNPAMHAPAALLPQVDDDSPYHAVRKLLASAGAPVNACGEENDGPFCEAQHGLTVASPGVIRASLDSPLSVLPQDLPPLLRSGEGLENPGPYPTYDPVALAGNLRHLGWVAMERRTHPTDGYTLGWVVDQLSDKHRQSGAGLGGAYATIFTAWDLGESYKGKLLVSERSTYQRYRRDGTWDMEVDPTDEHPAGVRIARVPTFARRARNRLDWETAALTGRGWSKHALLDERAEGPALSAKIMGRYARKVLTGRGHLLQANYLSPSDAGGGNAAGLGLTFYPTGGSQLLRAVYLGLDGNAQISAKAPGEREAPFFFTGHLGFAPAHALHQTRMIGPDHPLVGFDVGVYGRAWLGGGEVLPSYVHPLGDGPLSLGYGVEARVGVLGLFSVGWQFIPGFFSSGISTGLAEYTRVSLGVTVPIGARLHGSDYPCKYGRPVPGPAATTPVEE